MANAAGWARLWFQLTAAKPFLTFDLPFDTLSPIPDIRFRRCATSLCPEVKAAAVKVAGDWALHIATRKKEMGSKEPLSAILACEFESAYHAVVGILERDS